MKTDKSKLGQLIWFLVLLSALVLFFATGCTVTRYVPVELKTVEYRDRYVTDSIYNRDTVHVFTRGDTVFNNVIKWRERFRLDTVTHIKTDSVPYAVEVEKYTNQLTKWQRWRLNALNVIAAGLLVWLFFVFRKLLRW